MAGPPRLPLRVWPPLPTPAPRGPRPPLPPPPLGATATMLGLNPPASLLKLVLHQGNSVRQFYGSKALLEDDGWAGHGMWRDPVKLHKGLRSFDINLVTQDKTLFAWATRYWFDVWNSNPLIPLESRTILLWRRQCCAHAKDTILNQRDYMGFTCKWMHQVHALLKRNLIMHTDDNGLLDISAFRRSFHIDNIGEPRITVWLKAVTTTTKVQILRDVYFYSTERTPTYVHPDFLEGDLLNASDPVYVLE